MNTFYSYFCNIGPSTPNAMVVHLAGFGFQKQPFFDHIKSQFSKSPFSKTLIIITAEYNAKVLSEEFLSSEKEISQLKSSVNSFQELSIYVCYVKNDGTYKYLSKVESNDPRPLDMKSKIDFIFDVGMDNIVRRRNLVMEASENYHFIKPSGKHSGRFIKAANLMESGAEVSFLALLLLKHTKEKVDRIFVDTAGILPLAYKLAAIKSRFHPDCNHCFIDNFGSYDGFNSYDFSSSSNSIVLVSASTSNDLLDGLKASDGLEQAKIITVFSAMPCPATKNVIFDFGYFYEKFDKELYRPFSSTSEEECELCIYEKSIPLYLSKSQFIFESPEIKTYLPFSSDSGIPLRTLISDYKDEYVFKCLFDGLNGKTFPTPEFFVDVGALIKNSDTYKKKVKNIIKRAFPLYSDLIIQCDDSGAGELATYINDELSKINSSKPIKGLHEIKSVTPKKGVVVIAGSCQSGRSLLNISRALRKFKNIPITYIVGFAKFNDTKSFKKLQNDLTFYSGDIGNHKFHTIEEIMLPLNEFRLNSWDREIDLLTNIQTKSKKSRSEVTKRLSFIRECSLPENKGIGDKIFLPSPTGKNYILGPTFAFWNKDDVKEPYENQGTVYFTIASILQSLRYNKNKDGIIPLEKGYLVNQLDPLLFDRFNEGVIQAAVLRCSKPRELDYSSSDHSSKIVSTLLERMIENPSDDESEALPEFLLALCTEKLQIKKDHISFLQDKKLNASFYPLTCALLEHAKKVLFLGGGAVKTYF